jgi:hypothetical protein
MLQSPHFNRRQAMKLDIVTIGRVVGILIILFGIALAVWDAVEGFPDGVDAGFRWRFFLGTVLTRISFGALVILAAEIADRLWRNPPEALAPADAGDGELRAETQASPWPDAKAPTPDAH